MKGLRTVLHDMCVIITGNLEHVLSPYSKSTAVVIDNDILEDIQVIEPEIRSSDRELYHVSKNLSILVKTLLNIFHLESKFITNKCVVFFVLQALQEEVERLTDLLETTQKVESTAVFLCRRGAVLRKVNTPLPVEYTFFLYRNTFYSNIEAEICEILRKF